MGAGMAPIVTDQRLLFVIWPVKSDTWPQDKDGEIASASSIGREGLIRGQPVDGEPLRRNDGRCSGPPEDHVDWAGWTIDG